MSSKIDWLYRKSDMCRLVGKIDDPRYDRVALFIEVLQDKGDASNGHPAPSVVQLFCLNLQGGGWQLLDEEPLPQSFSEKALSEAIGRLCAFAEVLYR